MGRSMGGGRKACITKLGCPALDSVDILDYCDAHFVGKVEDQQVFHEKCVASLRK